MMFRLNLRVLYLHCVFLVTNFPKFLAFVKESDLLPYQSPTIFHFSDDDHTNIYLIREFKFFGQNYQTVHVNGNGILTFGAGSNTISYGCTTNQSIPTVGAFMADAKNYRNASKVFHKQDTAASSLNIVSRDIKKAFPSFHSISLRWLLVVTWYRTKPYNLETSSLYNTFQVILATDGTFSFVLLYYNQIMWPTLLSGRPAAQAGFFEGKYKTSNSYIIPGSCSNYSLVNIAGSSNIDTPGKFVFRVDETLQHPSVSKCFPSFQANAKIDFVPSKVPAIGGVPLLIRGFTPCLSLNISRVFCEFHENSQTTTVEGKVIPTNLALICPSPEFSSLGRVKTKIVVTSSNGSRFTMDGFVHVVTMSNHEYVEVLVRNGNDSLVGNLSLFWDQRFSSYDQIEHFFEQLVDRKFSESAQKLNLTLLEFSGKRWRSTNVATNFGIAATLRPTFSDPLMDQISAEKLETPPRVLRLSNRIILNNRQILQRNRTTSVIQTSWALAKLKIVTSDTPNIFDKRCKQWHFTEPDMREDVLPCPPNVQLAEVDWRFIQDTLASDVLINPLNFTIYSQRIPSESGASSQCFYNSEGQLETGYPHGSRVLRKSPNLWNDPWSFYWEDVMPFLTCCHLSYLRDKNCKNFFEKRAFNEAPTYQPPKAFRVVGATHFSTLHGTTYLFNGVGTFLMMKCSTVFKAHLLLEQYAKSGTKNSTTIVTGLVIQHANANRTLQVSANPNGLLVWFEKQPVNFYHDRMLSKNYYKDESFTLHEKGLTLHVNGTSSVLFTSSSGISLKVSLSTGNKSLNIIGTVGADIHQTCHGLVTNFDKNTANERSTETLNSIPAEELYREVGRLWRLVNASNLLFHDELSNRASIANKLSQTFQKHQFSRENLLTVCPKFVKTLCESSPDCEIDYQLTDNSDFAKSSRNTFQEFQQIFNATQMNLTTQLCERLPNVSNGGFLGQQQHLFTLGKKVQPYCLKGYSIDMTSGHSEDGPTKQNITFQCVRNLEGTLAWVSEENNQPLSSFKFECVPIDDKMKKVSIDPKLNISPKLVSILGSAELTLEIATKLKTPSVLNLTCQFGETAKIIASAKLVEVMQNSSKLQCIVPVLEALGMVKVTLVVTYLDDSKHYFIGNIWVQKLEEENKKLLLSPLGRNRVWVTWDISVFKHHNESRNSSCDLSLAVMSKGTNRNSLTLVSKIDSEICNTGSYEVSDLQLQNISVFKRPQTFVLTENISSGVAVLLSDLIPTALTLHDVLENYPKPNTKCESWYKNIYYQESIPSCPPTLEKAKIDWRFFPAEVASWYSNDPRVGSVFSQNVPSAYTSGCSQCAYDKRGNLLLQPWTGTRTTQFCSSDWKTIWDGYTIDILPFMACCKGREDCRDKFYQGNQNLENYVSPSFAHIGGVGHFQTFDGLTYRFNGAGDFWAIKYQSRQLGYENEFKCHIRQDLYNKNSSDPVPIFVTTGIAAEQSIRGKTVRVEVIRRNNAVSTRRAFDVYLNHYILEEESLKVWYHEGVNIVLGNLNSHGVLLVFQLGVSIRLSIPENTNESGLSVIFSMSHSFKSQITGLFGNFDENDENDFETPHGAVLPINSSTDSVHHDFGMKWRVVESESLFSKAADPKVTLTVSSPIRFSASFQAIQLMGNAEVLDQCGNNTDCLFDYLATASTVFAVEAKASDNNFQEIVATSKAKTKLCPPLRNYVNFRKVNYDSFALSYNATVFCEEVHDNGNASMRNLTFTCIDAGNFHLAWKPEIEVGYNGMETMCSKMPDIINITARNEDLEGGANTSSVVAGQDGLVGLIAVLGVLCVILSVLLWLECRGKQKLLREREMSEKDNDINLLEFLQ